MQYLTRYMTMLKVFENIANMPSGGGWVVASDIVKWTTISRPTIYRYLKILNEKGILIKCDHTVGKRVYSEYKMSQGGIEFYNSQKVLFNWD